MAIGEDVERDAANSYAAAAQYKEIGDAEDELVMVDPPPVTRAGPFGFTLFSGRRVVTKSEAAALMATTGQADGSVQSTVKVDDVKQAAAVMFSDDEESLAVSIPAAALADDIDDDHTRIRS